MGGWEYGSVKVYSDSYHLTSILPYSHTFLNSLLKFQVSVPEPF